MHTDLTGVRCRVEFTAGRDTPSWFWHVRLVNDSEVTQTVDLVWLQDVALAPYGAVRTNEYYVSQYLDLTPVPLGSNGSGVAVRQNMPGERQPWALFGCLGRADRWSTDARQLTGGADRQRWPDLERDLPAERLQHEHTVVGLQHEPIRLEPGMSVTTGFFGIVVPDHPAATSAEDAAYARLAMDDPGAAPPSDHPADAEPGEPIAVSLFHRAPLAAARDLTPAEFGALAGPGADHEEGPAGEPFAAFTGTGAHLVAAGKQRAVLRPHGHLIRSGASLEPDEEAVTATCWMAGQFLAQLTQGHVSRVPVLSVQRSYLGLQRAAGLRIFVADPADPADPDGRSRPGSSWMRRAPGGSRPMAAPGGTSPTGGPSRSRPRTPETDHVAVVEVRADRTAPAAGRGPSRPVRGRRCRTRHSCRALRSTTGSNVRTDDGPVLFEYPAAGTGSETEVGDDGVLFIDGDSRGAPWLTFRTGPTTSWSLTVRPALAPADSPDRPSIPPTPDFWAGLADAVRFEPPDTAAGRTAGQIAAVLPWFAHDAVIHYLSPRGLEQYTGGGWGTRDVCQGPVGLLLTLGRFDELRALILRIFAAQNERGDWPQAFDFYRRFVNWNQQDAHGDVVYWPLLALGDYLAATGDASVLAELVCFVGDGGPSEPASLLHHVDRALDAVERSRIAGTALPAYGHGDWNDSLQPADPELAARMCSTWTVTLQAQALHALAEGMRAGAPDDPAIRATAGRADGIADDGTAAMRELLLVDGVLAGYGLFDAGSGGAGPDRRPVEHLVHPRDRRTGLTYSILPMIHAISGDLLTPDEAAAHLGLISDRLTGPDGGRLFDRPVQYTGGPMQVFQRAEASTFFGREIGIMYTHAHLRYAEALARTGDADGLLHALALADPIGITQRVASARPRQSTTYFSSSDAVFADRYAAADGYAGVLDGSIPLEGGWRVYSSGPGLFLRLVVEQLCGIRRRGSRVEIDPVLAGDLDGLAGAGSVARRRADRAVHGRIGW